MYDTHYRLCEWMSGATWAEYVTARVLNHEGRYDGIEPQQPLGGSDKKADALAERNGEKWIIAVYFPRGQQTFSTIKAKCLDDAKGISSRGADGMVFVTNQLITVDQKEKLRKQIDGAVEFYDRNRLVQIIDSDNTDRLRDLIGGGPIAPAPVELPAFPFGVEVQVDERILDWSGLASALETHHRVALIGPSGAGKTFVALHAAAVHNGLAAVIVRLESWAPGFSERLRDARKVADVRPALDVLLEFADEETTVARFGALVDVRHTLLVVDGVNEVTDTSISRVIVDTLHDAVREWRNLSVLVTDRSPAKYEGRWVRAQIRELPETKVQQMVDEKLGHGTWTQLSAAAQRLLTTPFFLSRVLDGGDPRSATRASALHAFLEQQTRVGAARLDDIAARAFQAYLSGVRTISAADVPDDLLDAFDGAGVWRQVKAELLFEHQLYGDYLVARHLATRPSLWTAEIFNAVSFQLQSRDAVMFAFEQLDEGRGDAFVRALYDWHWVSSIECLVLEQEAARAVVSTSVRAALVALLSERRGDPVEGTALRSTMLLDELSDPLSEQLRTVEPERSADVLANHSSDGPWFDQWRAVFCRSDHVRWSEQELSLIADSDAILGWTVANAVRRGTPSQETAHDLRFLFRSARGAKSAAIRWRAVHALGKSADRDSAELLLQALASDDDSWVRFGAVRSSLEQAALTDDPTLRDFIFAELILLLASQDDLISGVAPWSVMYKGAGTEFRDRARGMFEALRDVQQSVPARERWQTRLESLNAYWEGRKHEAYGSTDPYSRPQWRLEP
jgi:hypothetical protein